LLATLKDQEGRVLIQGFYEGIEPLTKTERNALGEVPNNDAELMRSLGVARVDGGGTNLIELHNYPLSIFGACQRVASVANWQPSFRRPQRRRSTSGWSRALLVDRRSNDLPPTSSTINLHKIQDSPIFSLDHDRLVGHDDFYFAARIYLSA